MARTPQRRRYYYAFAYGPLFVVSLSSEYVTSTKKGAAPPALRCLRVPALSLRPPARPLTPARACTSALSSHGSANAPIG
jgi:hypothetical protein